MITSVAREALDCAGLMPGDVDEIVLGHYNAGMTALTFPSSLAPRARRHLTVHARNACRKCLRYRISSPTHRAEIGPIRRCTAGRPLPGTRRGANRAVLAAEAGISSIRRRDHQALIRAAEQTVGVDPYTWVPITISGQLDGQQWTNGISTNHHPTMSVKVLRESEVKHLRRGCVAVHRTPDGTPYRWTVIGTAFKGASDPNGVEATWTVGAPVARAIEVLERLVRPDADLLFTFLTGSTGDTSRKTGPNQVFITTATNMQLNDLCTWINSYCAAHGRSDHIQRVDGAPWVLTTRQFRRTLAWFIARRPGGSVAGAIAYRHLSIHVFEGYAGTGASGFRAEVEAEQAILRGENLMAMIDQHEHTQLAGPAAKEAAARLAEFAQGVQFTGAVLTDPHRIKRLLSKSGGSIYPGKYSTCVFDARKALCLNGPAAGDAAPRLDHCQPLSCTNVALTRENVAHLAAEATKLGLALEDRPALPPMLHSQLADRRHQIQLFLDRHTKDHP
ncbi:hypothetical protein MPY17_33215 [Rhodococcus opacus]|uniref:hypothetical protein n=1 Tax=Rhodococcus opacus TaxID=37919 RepID=UPI0021584EFC|nr:hypothetical protein [Rhodococcus opacus]UOT03724.2 hypothetical protein MPY17_33215 [Rhodococcus opacus]